MNGHDSLSNLLIQSLAFELCKAGFVESEKGLTMALKINTFID